VFGNTNGKEVIGCGESTYVADGSAGLRVIDVGTPESPAEVGSHLPPNRVPVTEDCGGLFYVDQTPNGVEIVQDCEAIAIDEGTSPRSRASQESDRDHHIAAGKTIN